jgi:predicted transcriptional regulator
MAVDHDRGSCHRSGEKIAGKEDMTNTHLASTAAENMRALTTRIVTAYLRSNKVFVNDLPGLIQVTYAALVGVSSPQPEPIEQQQPAVSLRKSVTSEAILCLECGKGQKMLKRHLQTAHGLSVEDYKSKWLLPINYPMVAPDYAERRSALAKASGLGHSRKKPQAEPTAEPAATTPRHRYPAPRWSKPTK